MDGKGCLADSGCPAWWGQAAERSRLPPHCPGVSRGWENKGIWRDPYTQKRLVEPPGRKWRYLNSKEKKKILVAVPHSPNAHQACHTSAHTPDAQDQSPPYSNKGLKAVYQPHKPLLPWGSNPGKEHRERGETPERWIFTCWKKKKLNYQNMTTIHPF